eukprot:scaffold806_cov229-Prasinococcus_capsulatus_cf.AAC.1
MARAPAQSGRSPMAPRRRCGRASDAVTLGRRAPEAPPPCMRLRRRPGEGAGRGKANVASLPCAGPAAAPGSGLLLLVARLPRQAGVGESRRM